MLIKCQECGREVSDQAAACPVCGAPPSGSARVGGTEASASAPRSRPHGWSRTKILAAILIIGLGVGFVYYEAIWDEGERDGVNRVLSGLKLPVTPWVDRAQAALRKQLAKPEQAQVVATAVLGFLHALGGEAPKLAEYKISAMGDVLVARLEVSWTLRTTNLDDRSTIIVWRCTKSQDLGVELVADSGLMAPTADDMRQLIEWFRTKMYPVVLANSR